MRSPVHLLFTSRMPPKWFGDFSLLDIYYKLTLLLQVKVWFQNRRMKWRHAEEAKRKKEEEDKQDKTQGALKAEQDSKHHDITEICLKSDDENDNGDERETFEYSFDDDPHHDELVVDEVSSDEEDEHGVHTMRYTSSEENNKTDTSNYNMEKCDSDWIDVASLQHKLWGFTTNWMKNWEWGFDKKNANSQLTQSVMDVHTYVQK